MEIFYERLIIISIPVILILYFIYNYLFTVTVPTASMHPTIFSGDRLLIVRLPGKRKPVRGEILVFRYEGETEDTDRLMIKRVIGLPSEKTEIKDGYIYNDGRFLEEPYVAEKSNESMSFLVPPDSYLFLGDNRNASFDARYWKNSYVERKNIAGKAVFRFYPIKRIGFVK